MERNDVKLIWHSPRLSSDMESQTKRKSTYETLFNFDKKRHILKKFTKERDVSSKLTEELANIWFYFRG